jgi:flavin-dependent dehydrogenase
MRADVIVVGAGPAGSTAALRFARAGFDVLLLDRDSFPRAKPCGDCMSPQATRQLADLGVLDAVLAEQPARLEGWRIVAPGSACFQARFDDIAGDDPLVERALAIARDRLDKVLLDAARDAGTRVITGVRITDLLEGGVTGIAAAGEPFRAYGRLVVGADGLRSVIARRMGAPARRARLRKISLTAHMHARPNQPVYGEMHLAQDMCIGVAPVTAGEPVVCNVTVVVPADRNGRDVARDPNAFFLAALARFPALRHRLTGSFAPGPRSRSGRAGALLTSGPFDVPVRRVVGRGVALVGDAAGYYDPFTGQGIHRALADAALLAGEAAAALGRGSGPLPALHGYARRRRRVVRGTHMVQRMIEAVVSRSALADFAIGRLAHRPAAGMALLAVTGDLAPARSLFTPAVLLGFAGRAPEGSGP